MAPPPLLERRGCGGQPRGGGFCKFLALYAALAAAGLFVGRREGLPLSSSAAESNIRNSLNIIGIFTETPTDNTKNNNNNNAFNLSWRRLRGGRNRRYTSRKLEELKAKDPEAYKVYMDNYQQRVGSFHNPKEHKRRPNLVVHDFGDEE